MANAAFPPVALRRNSVALGLMLLLTSSPACVLAADADIPRLQADAERGSIKQEIELGAAYFAGRGVPQDEKRAAYWYEKAANAGDPAAQEQIGYFYEAGIGVARDPARAARWFQRAVAGGLIRAKVNLAIAYLMGEGVNQDAAMAEDLFRRAYAQGNGMAAYYLGEMYFYGKGVVRDEAAGEHWYEAGVKRHDPRSEFRFASILWQHPKDSDDVKRAVKLLREATAGGLVPAMHQLGIILLKRPELAASRAEAPALLKGAAEAGEWRSSVALGLLSRDGMAGTAVDQKAAYYHYRVAALQGGKDALDVVSNDLDALSGHLGAEQTAVIDAEARSWYADHQIVLQFVHRDGGKSKEYPVYAVASPDEGLHAGRLIPTEPSTGYGQAAAPKPLAN